MNFHETFNDSYARCQKDPNFIILFYELFIEKDDRFRLLFSNVDMSKQYRMLKASISMIMLASTSAEARNYVKKLGKRHGPDGIGAEPLDFDIWLTSLLEAVKMCDYQYNSEIEQAWRKCFSLGIAIMKEECAAKK